MPCLVLNLKPFLQGLSNVNNSTEPRDLQPVNQGIYNLGSEVVAIKAPSGWIIRIWAIGSPPALTSQEPLFKAAVPL